MNLYYLRPKKQVIKWSPWALNGSGGYVEVVNDPMVTLPTEATVCIVNCDVDGDGDEGVRPRVVGI